MGVAADHQVAGDDVALLGDELVADAFAHVVDRAPVFLPNSRIIVCSALTPSMGDGELWSMTTRDLAGVEHLVDAHALERPDGERRGAVLAHDEVDVGDNDVAGVRVST